MTVGVRRCRSASVGGGRPAAGTGVRVGGGPVVPLITTLAQHERSRDEQRTADDLGDDAQHTADNLGRNVRNATDQAGDWVRQRGQDVDRKLD
jgi:hypothetical protein